MKRFEVTKYTRASTDTDEWEEWGGGGPPLVAGYVGDALKPHNVTPEWEISELQQWTTAISPDGLTRVVAEEKIEVTPSEWAAATRPSPASVTPYSRSSTRDVAVMKGAQCGIEPVMHGDPAGFGQCGGRPCRLDRDEAAASIKSVTLGGSTFSVTEGVLPVHDEVTGPIHRMGEALPLNRAVQALTDQAAANSYYGKGSFAADLVKRHREVPVMKGASTGRTVGVGPKSRQFNVVRFERDTPDAAWCRVSEQVFSAVTDSKAVRMGHDVDGWRVSTHGMMCGARLQSPSGLAMVQVTKLKTKTYTLKTYSRNSPTASWPCPSTALPVEVEATSLRSAIERKCGGTGDWAEVDHGAPGLSLMSPDGYHQAWAYEVPGQ